MEESNKKNVVAIVVTYNRKELLKECIQALLNQEYKNCDILVIDNASTDGTREYINEYIEQKGVLYKNTGINIGGAGGFNFGMKEAYQYNYEYFWILDDDTIVKENSLNELMKAANMLEDNFGYLTSSVLWKDLKPCVMNRQKIAKDWYDNSDLIRHGIIKISSSSFVSFFIRRKVVEDIGLPIKDFFIWNDDVEYTNRISKRYECFLIGRSQVIHKTNDNNGSNIIKENGDRLNRYRFAYRNECVIARENGIRGIIKQFAKVNFHILKVLFSKSKRKLRKTMIIITASIEGIFFRPKIEYVGKKD